MDLNENLSIPPIDYWYYRYKFFHIFGAIKKFKPEVTSLADIGAGSAVFSKELVSRFPSLRVTAVDPYYSQSELKLSSTKITFSTNLNNGAYQVFLFTDVLEHIEFDQEFLTKYVDLADYGSLFIITVPSSPKLWSGHDEYLNHYRRYTRKSLTKTIKNAGLEIHQTKFLYSSIYPIIRVKRAFERNKKSSDLRDLPKVLNNLFTEIIKLDCSFAPWAWWGVSLLVIAEKTSIE